MTQANGIGLSMTVAERTLNRWTRTRPWRSLYAAGLDLLLPPGCAACRADIEPPDDAIQLCTACREQLTNLREPYCLRCGCELPASFTENQDSCSNCLDAGFRFRAVIALGAYRMETRTAMLQTKHPGGQPLAAALGQLLAARRRERLDQFAPTAVAPIPMHWTRRIRRGTNCPDTITEAVSACLGLPAAIGLLVRGQKTTRQADLPPGSRLANIKGVFRVAKGYELRGARVLLVDDILTTAATCNEAAKTLLAAGASDVAIAVIARAEPWK